MTKKRNKMCGLAGFRQNLHQKLQETAYLQKISVSALVSGTYMARCPRLRKSRPPAPPPHSTPPLPLGSARLSPSARHIASHATDRSLPPPPADHPPTALRDEGKCYR